MRSDAAHGQAHLLDGDRPDPVGQPPAEERPASEPSAVEAQRLAGAAGRQAELTGQVEREEKDDHRPGRVDQVDGEQDPGPARQPAISLAVEADNVDGHDGCQPII